MATRRAHQRMTRDDWIAAARAALITSGVEQVKVDRLAKDLGITRGSFYWFFKSREELLDALLKDWEQTNTTPMIAAVESAPAGDGHAQFRALMQVWLDEKDFSPAYDSAVRDWARTAPKVERVVRRVDNRRIELMHGMFRNFGYPEDEAFIRARVAYFHQVGYYTLHIKESRKTREDLRALYFKALTGFPDQPADGTA